MKRGTVEYRRYHREWKRNNPLAAEQKEARRVYMAAYYRANPGRHRDYQLRTKYGITLEAYEALVQSQDGRCAICKRPPTGGRTSLHVDHDHQSGRLRGLLCSKCNTALGLFYDDPAALVSAVEYLRRYR